MASSIRLKMRCVFSGLKYETASKRVYKSKRCVLFMTFRPSQRMLFMAQRNWVPLALTSMVNSLGYVGTVSYPKHPFLGQALPKSLTSSQCSTFHQELTTTISTLSFGNHLFANYYVLKHPLKNLFMSSFYIPKVLKSAVKIIEIGSQIKI